jgi:hypothetical protein
MEENEKITVGNNLNRNMSTEDEKKVIAQGYNIPEEFVNNDEFIIPTEKIDLPSQGLFYPNKKSTVEIKYMTAEEDNILFSSDLIKSGKVLDVLLEAVIKDKDLRPDEMLSGDRNYVLIEARRTGLGDEYKPGKIRCESCANDFEPIVDLSLLKSREITEIPDSEGFYSVILPVTKINIKFRLLRGSDEKRLSKAMEKKSGNARVSRLITERYLLQIMEVNGNRDKTYINKFISAMPTKDSLFFREYNRQLEPGIDLNYEFECEHCGHLQERDVPITSKLFYPDADV